MNSNLSSIGIALATLVGLSATQAQGSFVVDGSFETPPLSPGQYIYNPSGSPWTFSPLHSGIDRPASAFFAPPPPAGVQAAFLQASANSVSAHGWISQVITLPIAGTYSLDYLHAGRHNSFFTGNVQYEVLLGTTVIGTSSTTSFQPYTPVSFHFFSNVVTDTLTFRILSTQPLGDNTAFFDAVDVTLVPAPGAAALAGTGGLLLACRRRRTATPHASL